MVRQLTVKLFLKHTTKDREINQAAMSSLGGNVSLATFCYMSQDVLHLPRNLRHHRTYLVTKSRKNLDQIGVLFTEILTVYSVPMMFSPQLLQRIFYSVTLLAKLVVHRLFNPITPGGADSTTFVFLC